jgi:hypothetical protein
MKSPTPLFLQVIVDESERPALLKAKEQLDECLGAASGVSWPTRILFRESISAIDWSEPPTVVIASFLPAATRSEELLPSVEARWRADFGLLAERGVAAIFVCTVFRRVPSERPNALPDDRRRTVERIRRLNLLAAELSHDLGISVIDIDRVFAHFGARALRTDFSLVGMVAAEVAAHTIVSSILAAALDDFIPPNVQERARALLGDLAAVGALVTRRAERRQSA